MESINRFGKRLWNFSLLDAALGFIVFAITLICLIPAILSLSIFLKTVKEGWTFALPSLIIFLTCVIAYPFLRAGFDCLRLLASVEKNSMKFRMEGKTFKYKSLRFGFYLFRILAIASPLLTILLILENGGSIDFDTLRDVAASPSFFL